MTLREYLIALGFKVDEQGYRRFNESILKTSRNVTELGAEVVGTAAAIYTSVLKVARQFEDLYYVSQRTGSAVVALKSYEFGARQVGVSAEAARSSVEGMAAAIRTNPGLAGLIRGMGLDPNNAQAAVVGLVGKMKATFGEGGYFVAQNMASMFGLDETTFRQMWTNFDKLKEQEDDHRQRAQAAGVETQGTTEKFLAFSRAVNKLEDDLGILGQRIAQDFVNPTLAAVKAIDGLIQSINRLDNQSGGAVGVTGTIVGGAAGTWLLKRLLGRIFGFGGKAAAEGAAAAGGEAAAAAGSGIGSMAMRALGPLGILLGSTSSTAGKADDEPASAEYRRKHGGAGGGSARDRAMAFFIGQGWSKEAAAGLVANLYSESKLNPGAVGDGGQAVGIAQWHADRQNAFRSKFGKDLKDATLEEQLAFVQHELTQGSDFSARRAGSLLKGTLSAREAGAIVSKLYERPADREGAAASRGSLAESYLSADLTPAGGGNNVSVSAKTDIHVAPGPDAKSTADRVADAQTRTTGDLVRNTVGAIR